MTEKTNTLGWTLPSEKDESEAGEWGGILNNTIENDIEPDVAEALDVSGGNAQLSEARDRYNDAKQSGLAAYQRLGTGSLTQISHTQHIVGTRQMASRWPLVDPHFRTDDFSYENAGTNEKVQLINYAFLEQPPNMIPILRVMVSFVSRSANDRFRVGVKHRSQTGNNYLLEFENDDTSETFYDEIRLDTVDFGSAGRGPDALDHSGIEVHADISGTPTSGTIWGVSSLMLDWEVV